MFRNAIFALACVSLTALSACGLPRGGPIASEVVGDSTPEDITIEFVSRQSAIEIAKWPAAGWHGHYHWPAKNSGPSSRAIATGDKISMTIWDNQENSLLLGPGQRNTPLSPEIVSDDGTVFVPYIDHVQVAGLTPQQAREVIQNNITAIAPSAQVQLQVESGRQSSADMVSGVARPGSYPLVDRNVPILSVIAQSGGISDSIENPVVRLFRDGKNYRIPIGDIYASPSKNIIVKGGDQIIVEKDERSFLAFGALMEETQIYFHEDEITALEAVSLASGLNEARANPEGLLVLRQYPDSATRPDRSGPASRHVVFVFDLTNPDSLFAAQKLEIQPGDVVVASESAVKPAQAVLALVGSLFALSNVFE